jgi:hypothetical protein
LDDVEIDLLEGWKKSPQCLGTTMNKAALFLLIGELNKRCECGGRWEADVLDSYDVGHAFVMVLRCDNDGCQQSKIWESSKRFSDGSYEVNRQIVAAWILSGGQGQDKYSEFFKTANSGCVGKTTYYRYQQPLSAYVHEEAQESFQQVVNEENQRIISDSQLSGSQISIDTQWSCQPRNGQRANEATATMINQENHKIIGQYSVSKADLVAADGIKCLDKLATQRGLHDLVDKLECIAQIVTDGCGSAAKSVRDIVQNNDKHKDVEVQKDVWHKNKKLMKSYKSLISLKENSELASDIPVDKIKKHFFHCCNNAGGNADHFKEMWLGAPKHWEKSKGLSNFAVIVLQNWMDKEYKGIRSSLIE